MFPIIIALLLICTPVFATDTVKIQVITEEQALGNTFRDAIYYGSMDEYQIAISNGTHEAEKLKRISNYVNTVENPPAPVEITKEQYLEAKAQLEAQVAEVNAKIAEIDSKPKLVAEEVKPE